jgi:hypothetical protein
MKASFGQIADRQRAQLILVDAFRHSTDGKRLDPGGQPRELTGDRVGMDHALARGTLHLRLCRSQRIGRRGLVAGGNRGFHLLHEGTHTRLARMIPGGAGHSLTDALAR